MIKNTEMKRRPRHPDELLREDFMPGFGLTVTGLAEDVGVSRQTIKEDIARIRPLRVT